MTKHVHGGDVYRHKDCLDFSANLNPLGTPESVKQAIIGSLDHIAQYPQVGCDLLREKIAEYEGVKKEEIVCGNGAAEVIFTRFICPDISDNRSLEQRNFLMKLILRKLKDLMICIMQKIFL